MIRNLAIDSGAAQPYTHPPTTSRTPVTRPMTRHKRTVFLAVLLLIVAVALEFACRIGLWANSRYRNSNYFPVVSDELIQDIQQTVSRVLEGKAHRYSHHPVLGWTSAPGVWSEIHTVNEQGIRSAATITLEPPVDRIRLAAFGDSFTFCDDVPDHATWQRELSRLSGNLEVLNFGVGGYAPDQAYLRYQLDGKAYRPQIVLIGFMYENIRRMVNVYRPFYLRSAGIPYSKPRFLIEDSRLTLIPNPMTDLADLRDMLPDTRARLDELGAHDHWYRIGYRQGPFDGLALVRMAKMASYQLRGDDIIRRDKTYVETSEAFAVLVAVIESFCTDAGNDGAKPVVIMFPDQDALRIHRTSGTKVYEALISALIERELRVIDILDGFETIAPNVPPEDLIPAHFSAQGNTVAAGHILSSLAAFNLLDPGQKQASRTETRPGIDY
jgi:hypothetical protein